ncbi:MAG TPA: transcriptional regulator [Silvibacterium sp.]|nr:transcriptional regulator [Silvibacterium sp.]
MNRTILRLFFLGIATLTFIHSNPARAAAVQWVSVGPEGGDARSFAYDPADPAHIYMGTTNSWIYQSTDGGATWKRLVRLGKVDDLIVDNMVIDSSDPKTIYAGVWQLDRSDGGVYISHDGGTTWTSSSDMDGKSVRALSQAPSNPKILVAGAISGVYRSEDSGLHWTQISPVGSGEIHKVESVAIDPTDTKTIYAGTWHLPWKTTDGGVTWHNIKQGLIDDSDVFSIIIDPTRPTVVYASACSGIYRSENGGEIFRKIQGIPTTARRTRVLMQDPVNRQVVYAGTTEGLYKTMDGGTNWVRTTGPDVIINDVYVDPKNTQHVMLATDRSGVLTSQDASATFHATNSGFSQRQVTALLPDATHDQTLYAGVVNDKSYGGVFVTEDGGKTWLQRSGGLDGRDIFSLAQADDGSIFAGTSHGIFRWDGSLWRQDGTVVNLESKTVSVLKKGKKISKTITGPSKPVTIDVQVNDLSVNGPVWFAATADGVYRSVTQGATWTGPVLTESKYRFVDAHGATVFAARREDLRLSEDSGVTWTQIALPDKLTSVRALTTAPNGTLWVGGREGAFFSDDRGQTWHAMDNLPIMDINNVDYDAVLKRVVVTSSNSTMVFAIDPDARNWKWWDAGWNVRMVHSMGGHLIGASLYDGVVVEPKESDAAAAGMAQAQR